MPNVYLQDKKLTLEFPDGMTEQQIQDAIEREFYPDAYQQRLLDKSTEDEPMLNRPLLKKDDGTVRVAGKGESVAMQAMKDLGIDKDLSAMAQGKPPADHFEGQRNALDGGLHEQVEAGNVRKDLKAEAINRKGYDALSDMVVGAANVASSTAKGIDAFFGSDTARKMADQIDAFSQQIAPTDPEFIDAVFQGIGSTALFLLPGLAVTGVVNKAKAGLKLAQVLGTTTMAAFEGLGEAGSVFDDKIKAGATRQEALRAATWTFLLNLPLNAVTDHFAFFLGDEGASVLKEIVRGGFNESLQEFMQGVISGAATKAPQVKEMGWDYYRNVPQEQVTMDFSQISPQDWGKILKGAGMEGLAASVSGGMFGGAGKIFTDQQIKNDEKEDLENFSKDNRSLTDLLARQQMSPSGENLLEKEANLSKEPKTLAEFLELQKAQEEAAKTGPSESPVEGVQEAPQDEVVQEPKVDSATAGSANLGAEKALPDGAIGVKVGDTFLSPVGKPFTVSELSENGVILEDSLGGSTIKTLEELNQGWRPAGVNPAEEKVQEEPKPVNRDELPPTKEMEAWDKFTGKKAEEGKRDGVSPTEEAEGSKADRNTVPDGKEDAGFWKQTSREFYNTVKELPGGKPHGNASVNAAAKTLFKEGDPRLKAAREVIAKLKSFAKEGAHEKARFQDLKKLGEELGVYTLYGKATRRGGISLGQYIESNGKRPFWHEIGHSLIESKQQKDSWEGPTPDNANPEWEAMPGLVGQSYNGNRGEFKGYGTRRNERYARLFNEYMTNNAKLKELAPTLYDKIEKLIDEHTPLVAALRETVQEVKDDWENGIKRREDQGPRPSTNPIKRIHRLHIEKALEEGKAVPEEVLAEYPELVGESKKGAKANVVQKQDGGKKAKGKPATVGSPDEGGTVGPGSGGSAVSKQAEAPRASKETLVPDDFQRIVTAREERTGKADESVVPDFLKKGMYPHQVQGVAKMVHALEKGGGILADGTGVGKTTEILGTAAIFRDRGKRVLIVAPAGVIKPDWKSKTYAGSYVDDATRLGVKNIDLYEGGKLRDGISITTYERFDRASDQIDKDTVVIFDEAHYLKNSESNRAAAGIAMAAKADSVLFATATPADKVEHIVYMQRAGILEGLSVEEQFVALGLRKVEKKKKGRNGRTETITFWTVDPQVGAQGVLERWEALFDRMTEKGRMIKRELNLQGTVVRFENVTLSQEAEETLATIETSLTDGAGVDSMQGLKKAWVLMHMRRQMEPYKIASAVKAAQEELAEGRQVVLFLSRVNFSAVEKKVRGLDGEMQSITIHESEGTAETLRKALEAVGITDIAEIHGNAEENGNEAMARFQSGEAKVVIATVESGGTGINLDDRTGDAPRTIIMITSPFDAVNHVQAAGRIWRITTKTFPRLRYLVANHAVDEWNMGIVQEKFGVLGATVQGELRVLSRGKQSTAEAGVRPEPAKATGPEIVPYGEGIAVKNAYEIKDRLKALGARWNKAQKLWTLAADQRPAVEAILRGETSETEKAIADPMAMTAKNLAANILEEGFVDTEQLKADFPDEAAAVIRKNLRLFKRGGMGLDEAVDILQGKGFPIGSDSQLVNLLLGQDTATNATLREAEALDAAEAEYAQAHTTGGAPVLEQAKTDAETVSKDTLRLLTPGAEISDPANLDFVRAFRSDTVAKGDQVFADGEGKLTQRGSERIRNALLYAAYGDEQIVKLAAEATDNDMKTLTNALVAVAPDYARLRAALKEFNREDLDIAADLSAAFQNFTGAKSAPTLDEFFSQRGMFGEMSFAGEKLLRAFVQNRRSASKISGLLNKYIEQATGESDPQGGLFEDEEGTRGKEELIDDMLEFHESSDGPNINQEILFGSAFPFLPNNWKSWLTQRTTDPILNRILTGLHGSRHKRLALYIQYLQGRTSPDLEILLRPKDVGVGAMERMFSDLGAILSKSTHGRIVYEAAREFKTETIREYEQRLGAYQEAVKDLTADEKAAVFKMLESQKKITGADPVSVAAARVREILDEAYQHLVTNGIKSGYREQYVPHVFDGDFWVKVDGAPSIPAASIGEALEIAETHIAHGQKVQIVQEGYHSFDAGVANLSPAKFYKMVGVLGKQIQTLTEDDIKEILHDNNIFPETFKRRFMANLLERFSNNPFYTRDLDSVLEFYLYQVSRKVAQDRFSGIAHRQMKAMPRNEKDLANFIEQEYLPAVLSHPTRLEKGIARALQTMFPSISPLDVRKGFSRVSAVQYVMDLGFSLVSAVANASQFWINTASIVGLPGAIRAYGMGVRTFTDAGLMKIVADSGAIESVSSITGRPIFAGNYLQDLKEKLTGKQGAAGLMDLPLEMFQTVELQNRFASFWAAHNQAQAQRGKGGGYAKLAGNLTSRNAHVVTLGALIDARLADTTKTRNAAWTRKTDRMIREFSLEYGMEMVERTQFRHGRENLPLILHSGVLRLVSPYKSFLLSQLKFTTESMKLFKHPAQTLRFVGLSYFFAGVAGNPLMLMVFKIINWLSKELFGKDLEHSLKAHNLWRGPLAGLGLDISGAVAMNMPRKAEDLLGRYSKFLLHMTQGIASGLRGESPVFEYRKARRDLLPAQVQRTLDALDILEQGAYVSPISRERTAVDNPYTAAFQRVLGFMPPRVSAAFEASEEIRTKKDHYANLSRNMRERLVDAMARGDTMEVNDVFEDVGNRVLKAMKDLRKATERKDRMAQAGAMAELIFWKRWIQNDDAVKDAYERRWIPQQVESVRSAPFYLRSWGWQKQQSYSIGGGD